MVGALLAIANTYRLGKNLPVALQQKLALRSSNLSETWSRAHLQKIPGNRT
jgi:hypothetical protein